MRSAHRSGHAAFGRARPLRGERDRQERRGCVVGIAPGAAVGERAGGEQRGHCYRCSPPWLRRMRARRRRSTSDARATARRLRATAATALLPRRRRAPTAVSAQQLERAQRHQRHGAPGGRCGQRARDAASRAPARRGRIGQAEPAVHWQSAQRLCAVGLDKSGELGEAVPRALRHSRSALASSSSTAQAHATAGENLVKDVILPVMERAKAQELEAGEVEALEMIAKGFEDLSLLNSRLAYSTIVDLLLSMNDNEQARENLSTTFRQRLTRPQMAKLQQPDEAPRSPIADLLYGRWLEGLRNRWIGY